MGIALRKLDVPRENLVVSTKLFFSNMNDKRPNTFGTSRKHIIEGMNNCLQRLQFDYVDVVFAHRYDHETPMEETCRAFNHLIQTGKVFYWGTSEWEAEHILEAYAVCDRLGLIKPIVE